MREATAADQPLLAAIYRACRDDLALLGNGPAIDALIAMQQHVHDEGRRRQYPDARQLLLYRDGVCVAQLALAQLPHSLHLIDIAVVPTARGRGLGRELLRWSQRQATVAGVPLTLHVRRDNHPARHLYLGLSFRAVGDAVDGGDVGDDVFEPMRWTPGVAAPAN